VRSKRLARRADPSSAPRPGLVLDAGALLALEKRPIRLLADLRRAHENGLLVRIPAGALAQSWRGGPRSPSIARLLKQPCSVVQVDELSAKDIGEFIASVHSPRGGSPDVVDAHVALTARATRSLVWTSDPRDIELYGVEPEFIREV
jgi:hypothetical protein